MGVDQNADPIFFSELGDPVSHDTLVVLGDAGPPRVAPVEGARVVVGLPMDTAHEDAALARETPDKADLFAARMAPGLEGTTSRRAGGGAEGRAHAR